MSPKAKSRGGYNPAPEPSRMTPQEYQELAKSFKDLFADQPLIKWSIVAAGAGGVLDGLHVLWIFVKEIARHL